MDKIYNLIWQDQLWLPNGVHFEDLEDKPGVVHAHTRDLYIVPLISLGIYVLRIVYERLIALPFARYHGLCDGTKRKKVSSNVKLQSYFKQNPRPLKKEIQGLAKQLDWTTRQVERWLRRKRNWNRPCKQTKFCETSWRFLFYTGIFVYGICTLWQTNWFWDNSKCWEDFVNQNLDQSIYVYYMAEVSFYLSLLFTVMGDIKRKDFTEQVIHHVATLFLIVFSYITNFVRIGTLVMLVHDVSDIILEGTKCILYFNYTDAANVLFVIFAVVFFITRLFIFPFWIIHTSAVKSLETFNVFALYYFFNGFLLILLCLHIFWGSIIIKMAYNMVIEGEVKKDERSDSEEESSDGEE